VATAVARTGRRFLPRSADDDALQDALDDALETYEERRQAAADSAMFRTLLDEGGLSMFAKDDQARYVRMANVPYTPDPDEVRGKTDVEVFDHNPAVAEAATDDDLEVVATGEAHRGGKRENFSQRGGEYWSESTKIPWRDSDGDDTGPGRVRDRDHGPDTGRAETGETAPPIRRVRQLRLSRPPDAVAGVARCARTGPGGDEKALDRIERANERIKGR